MTNTEGVLVLYNPHVHLPGITINEWPDHVRRDLLGAIERIVPRDYPYRHAEAQLPPTMTCSPVPPQPSSCTGAGCGSAPGSYSATSTARGNRRVWWRVLAG